MNESEGWEGLERSTIESSSRKVLNPSEGLFREERPTGKKMERTEGNRILGRAKRIGAGCLMKISGLAGNHWGLLNQYLSHENQKVHRIRVGERLVSGPFD